MATTKTTDTADVETEVDNAADGQNETTDEPKRSRTLGPITLRTPTLIALAVLLVAAIAGTVTFGLLYKAERDTDAAAEAALKSARSFAVKVTSYQADSLDKNFADVLDGATGEFKQQYTGASTSLRELIHGAKATATGQVIGAAVESATTDRAQVLLHVDQSVTNKATDKPRVDRNRMLMTLERHDDRWLVSKIELR